MRYTIEHYEVSGMLGGAIATFIQCDTCQMKIKRGEDAVVVFSDPPGGKDGPRSVVAIHKIRCETTATRDASGWQDLDIFLRDIVKNAGIDLEETEKRISGPDGLADWGLHT